jgi:hypothetical protein
MYSPALQLDTKDGSIVPGLAAYVVPVTTLYKQSVSAYDQSSQSKAPKTYSAGGSCLTALIYEHYHCHKHRGMRL